MAVRSVACPYCSVQTSVTIPRGAEISKVLKEGSASTEGSDAGCPNGHRFKVIYSRTQ
ncbi:hypothetical protein [Halovenus sp. HT40]|uniref:hypothetical protein n=1 Tax=Halovenus sp. HT40 TaxID=3126691 RepID=UPI003FA5806E